MVVKLDMIKVDYSVEWLVDLTVVTKVEKLVVMMVEKLVESKDLH